VAFRFPSLETQPTFRDGVGEMEKEMKLKFKQIISAPWVGSNGKTTHSIYGLGEDGYVYRFTKQGGWEDIDSGASKDPVSMPRSARKVEVEDDVPF
jgi:hypothetical protein